MGSFKSQTATWFVSKRSSGHRAKVYFPLFEIRSNIGLIYRLLVFLTGILLVRLSVRAVSCMRGKVNRQDQIRQGLLEIQREIIENDLGIGYLARRFVRG